MAKAGGLVYKMMRYKAFSAIFLVVALCFIGLVTAATWGDIGGGDDGEVVLNSPADGSTTFVNEVLFNATATITGGPTLVNMSLFTNETGTWGIRNTTEASENATKAHGQSITSDAPQTDFFGMAFKYVGSNPYRITSVKAVSGAGCDYARLYEFNGTILSTSDISDQAQGGEMTFNDNVTLQPNVEYRIECNTPSGDRKFGDVGSYPTVSEEINWTQCSNNGVLNCSSGKYLTWNNIESINISQSPTTFTQTWNRTITDDIIWNVQACDSDGDCGFNSTNHTLFLDSDGPTIEVESPSGNSDYGAATRNETLNVTFTDTNLDSCWYDYAGTNYTIEGCISGEKNSTEFTLDADYLNMTIWTNDTIGNENFTTISWTYSVFETAQTFSEEALEGTSQTFTLNVSLLGGLRLSTAEFVYNGTADTASANEWATNMYRITYTKQIPSVSADVNVTFSWNITLEGGSEISSLSNNQTVKDIDLDDCSVFTNVLFNFTIYDEDDLSWLNGTIENTSMKIDLTLANPTDSTNNITFSQLYSKVNPASVCIKADLGDSNYIADALVEYKADNRFIEFYNIQNYSLTNETDHQNISLYNLNSSAGTEFKITYKDSNFNLAPGAIIQIQRQYIDEGVFRTVEIPKISSAGYTIAHLVRNDVVYNLVILRNGQVLDTFNNIVADCQNPAISECVININSFSSVVQPTSFSDAGDFQNSITWNATSRVITSQFAIPSGVPAFTSLNVTLLNMMGNQTVCSDGLVAAGGTLTCTVPDSFGNATVIVEIYSGGELKRRSTIGLGDNNNQIYGNSLIFMGLCILLSIIGMSITDNPMILGFMLIVGTAVLMILNISNSFSWVGVGATFLWLVVAIVIVFIKGANRQ